MWTSERPQPVRCRAREAGVREAVQLSVPAPDAHEARLREPSSQRSPDVKLVF